MPADFLVLAHTLEPPENQFLAEPGDTESPVVDAIQTALSYYDIKLESAEHGPSPQAFPPIYIVIVRTSSSLSEDDFREALENSWQSSVDRDGNPLPPADIQVQAQDEE